MKTYVLSSDVMVSLQFLQPMQRRYAISLHSWCTGTAGRLQVSVQLSIRAKNILTVLKFGV